MLRVLRDVAVLGITLVATVPPAISLAGSSIRCYVWDFATHEGKKTLTTETLTGEFEEKLAQSSLFTVLERKNLAGLMAQIDNEKAIFELLHISQRSLDTLRVRAAEAVFFGELFDDLKSGSYKVTVSLQRFDQSKLVWSVHIPHGKIDDAETREDAMEDLVVKIGKSIDLPNIKIRKQSTFDLITSMLNEYYLRAANLTDGFSSLTDRALVSTNSFNELASVVTRYNSIFDSLKIDAPALEADVTRDWDDRNASDHLHEVLTSILDDIHPVEIIVFNRTLQQVQSILNKTLSDEKQVDALKLEIRTAVPDRVARLRVKLDKLRADITALTGVLQPQ